MRSLLRRRSPGDKDPYLAFPEGIAEVRGNKRLEVLAKFNKRFTGNSTDERLGSTQTSIDEAVKLMRSPALEAFEFDKVPSRRRSSATATRRSAAAALLAKRLVEKGVRFVQVNRGGFDTHTNNFPAMRDHGEVMDPALASLVAGSGRFGPCCEKTLIIMLSEFGRTPKINKDAGRDH